MITKDHLLHRRLYLFLTPFEIDCLRDLAAMHGGWEKGRQNGAYFKLNLTELVDEIVSDEDEDAWLVDLVNRALQVIADYANVMDPDLMLGHDVYLIFYPSHTEIGRHTDPVEEGASHVRLNAVVVESIGGGVLLMLSPTGAAEACNVSAGDAVVFRPSDTPHSVSEVTGSRLVFSVGAKIQKP